MVGRRLVALASAAAAAAVALASTAGAAGMPLRTGASVRLASVGQSLTGYVTVTDWATGTILNSSHATTGFWDAFTLDQHHGRVWWLQQGYSDPKTKQWHPPTITAWQYRDTDGSTMRPKQTVGKQLTGDGATHNFDSTMAYDYVNDRLFLADSGYSGEVFVLNPNTGESKYACQVMGADAVAGIAFNAGTQELQWCFNKCFNVNMSAPVQPIPGGGGAYCNGQEYVLPSGNYSVSVQPDDTSSGTSKALLVEYSQLWATREYFYVADSSTLPTAKGAALKPIKGIMSGMFNGSLEWGFFTHMEPTQDKLYWAGVYQVGTLAETLGLFSTALDGSGLRSEWVSPQQPKYLRWISTDPIMHDFFTGKPLPAKGAAPPALRGAERA